MPSATTAESSDRPAQEMGYGGAGDQRDEGRGNAVAHPRPQEDDQQGEGGERHGVGIDRVGVLEVHPDPLDELRGRPVQPEAERIAQLLHRDDGADRRGEPGDHRKRNELDRGPQPGQAQGDQDHPGHERRQQQPVHPVPLDDAVDDHHEGAGRAADLHP